MKTILIFFISFHFFIFDKPISVTIIDENNEKLGGVLNKVSSTYSDLNGNLIIKKGDSIYLEMISYKKVNIEKVYSDTIIKMKSL